MKIVLTNEEECISVELSLLLFNIVNVLSKNLWHYYYSKASTGLSHLIWYKLRAISIWFDGLMLSCSLSEDYAIKQGNMIMMTVLL